jgi:hypothetical protein
MRSKPAGLAVAVLAGLAVVCGAAVPPAAAFHERTLHVQGQAWFPEFNAEARSSRAGIAGDLVTESDLGVDDPDVVWAGAVTLRIGRHTLRLDGFEFDVEGDRQITRTFVFDGRTYPVNTRVTSEAEAQVVGLDYGFDFVHTGLVSLGFTLGARYVATEASIQAVDLGLSGRGEYEVGMPAVGLTLVVHPFPAPVLSSLAVTGRASGGTIGDAGRFIDVDAGIEWLPFPLLSVRAGYRYFQGRGEDSGDEVDFDLSGPYVGLTLTF